QVTDHLVGGSLVQASVTNGTGNEVQQLVFSSDAHGGSFVLRFPGATAQSVEWSSDRGVLFANLRAQLGTMFGGGDVGAVPTADGQVRLVFAGQFAGQDVAPMTVVSGLVSKQAIVVSTIANIDSSEVQRLKLTGSPSGGVIVM